MARQATVEELLTRKKPVTRSVDVVLDQTVVEAVEEARRALEEAERDRRSSPDTIEEAREALLEAEEVRDAATVSMTLQAIGRQAYESLVADHPPTKEQIRQAKRSDPNAELLFNVDTFFPALLAASLVDPKMSEDEVLEMSSSEAWNGAEVDLLYTAALEVNRTSRVVSLGKGSGRTPS